jgi:hypothetical protein
MTSRGAMGLSSGAMVQDVDILERVARTFDGKSLPDEPSTPIDQRLISKMISGLKKKDGTPVSVNDFLGFLTRIADINDDRLGNHPGFNDWEEKILPIESLAGIFKELGHSRIDVPGSKTKKILGPVVNELTDLVGDEEFVQTAREYVLPPLEVWAKAAAKSILQMQEFRKDVSEPRREFMRREFRIEELDGVNSFVLRDINDEIIMSAPVANMSPRDRNSFQYSNINSILFGYHQQTPGIPFMTMVKRHLYPNDPLAEVLADRQVMSANNDAAMGGRNMAETLEGATLTPLDVYKFSESPAGQRVREMFEQAYTGVAHYDEFARRYAVRVRKLVSDAGLDPDSPEVKRALTTGWMQVVDTTEEPPENGGRFISAALLVRNLVAGLYRPSWDSAGESYTTPHEFMHLITGQGFTRHGEMASNIGWLGAFGKDVWPAVANLLTAQTRFFDMQKEDSEGGDLIEGNKRFRGLVLNEIKELLGGDGDDFGRTSQALLDELYQDGGVLRTEKSDGLFEGFGWIDPLFPLEAGDLGWGYKQNREDNADVLSLSSGANKNTGDLSDVRGIEETISTGPINLQYGRDSIGMPKMGTQKELAKKYGKSTQNIKKMFKENYKTYINFEKEPKGKEWLVVHASLQAIEDIFENLNTEQKMLSAFPEVQFRWPDRRGQSGDRTEPLGSYAFTPNQRLTRDADGQYLKGPDGKPQYVKETRFGIVAMNVNQLNDSYSDSVRLQGKVDELNSSFHVSSEFSEVGWQQDIGDGDLNASYETLILRAQQEEWYKNAKIRATQRKAYAVMVHEIGHAIDDSLAEVDDIIPQKRIFDSRYFSVSLGDLLPEPVSSYGRTNPKENLAEAFAAWFLFSGSKVTYKGENYGARASAMMALILERIKENSANQKVKLSIKQDKEEIPTETYDDDLPYNHPINVFAYFALVEEIRQRMKDEVGDENEQ